MNDFKSRLKLTILSSLNDESEMNKRPDSPPNLKGTDREISFSSLKGDPLISKFFKLCKKTLIFIQADSTFK